MNRATHAAHSSLVPILTVGTFAAIVAIATAGRHFWSVAYAELELRR